MSLIFLIVHLVVAAALVALVLTQRSEGGALGLGGGSGSLISGRGAADFLAKLTMGAGALFFLTSLTLTWLARDHGRVKGVDLSASGLQQSTTAAVGAPKESPAEPVTPADASGLAPDLAAPDLAPSANQAVQRAGPLVREEPAPVAVTPASPPPAVVAPVRAAPTPALAATVRSQTAELEKPKRAAQRQAQPTPAEVPAVTAPPPAEQPAPTPAPIPVRPRGGPE